MHKQTLPKGAKWAEIEEDDPEMVMLTKAAKGEFKLVSQGAPTKELKVEPGKLLLDMMKAGEGKQPHVTGVHSVAAIHLGYGTKMKSKSKLNSAQHPYVIMFRYVGVVATNGSGVMGQAIPLDVSGVADFSSAAALFNECRVLKASLRVSSQDIVANANVRTSLGFDPSLTNSTPASEADVVQLVPYKMRGPRDMQSVIKAKPNQNEFAACTSPVPGPYAGLWGQFSVYCTGTASTGAVNFLCEVVVEFRARR